ncbi:MAG TPA: hypothetical protein VNN99_03060 [Vicinamibacterales bacterium]|nr:hypothetical protein [Vicinamibacterales bacterium]
MSHQTAALISARVLSHIAAGLSPVDALKVVCGAEAVDAMIATLHDRLTTPPAVFRVFFQFVDDGLEATERSEIVEATDGTDARQKVRHAHRYDGKLRILRTEPVAGWPEAAPPATSVLAGRMRARRRYCGPCDAYTTANPCRACGAETDRVPANDEAGQ